MVVARQEEHQAAFLTARRHQELRVHVVERLLVHPLSVATRATAQFLARMHHGKVTLYGT